MGAYLILKHSSKASIMIEQIEKMIYMCPVSGAYSGLCNMLTRNMLHTVDMYLCTSD